MAKKISSTKKSNSSKKGQVREGHKIGDNVKAYQPTEDTTTTPPKGDKNKK